METMTNRPYLLEITETLWPADSPPQVHRGRPGPGARQTFIALPRGSRPRLLVPPSRAAAAAAVRAYRGQSSRVSHLRMQMAAVAMSLGLGPLLFRDRLSVAGDGGSITDELSSILGVPVQVAVRGGPPRANRKPVLAVFDAAGHLLLAFAKLGNTPLTERLVAAEAEALRRLAEVDTPSVRTPRVIHCGPWRDMVLLVQEALPIERSRPVREAMLQRAMREVAEALGTTTAPWTVSPHAVGMRKQLAGMPASAESRELGAAIEALSAQEVPLRLGCWHGDWTPWNCSAVRRSVLTWDWERFAEGVPVGFDALNYSLQAALARAGTPTTAQPEALLASAVERLAPFGVTPAEAQVTAVAYLIEIASRYMRDNQAAAGAHVGAVGSWLLPAITRATADLQRNGEKTTR